MEGELTHQAAPNRLTRRNFLKMGIGALGVAALVEMGGVGLLYLQPRETPDAFGKVINAGPVESFPAGSVTEFRNGRFFLVRGQEGGFLAVYRRCPHLGCNVNWLAEENHFHCPCHAASFDEYGDLESPPVPRPLDTFPVFINGGEVMVDTSRRQRREKFAPEQLAFAG